MNVIEINNISKTFENNVKALSNLSLQIPEGSTFGFFGPNGAGKTTTIRLANGILTPTDGEVKIFGKDIKTDKQEINRMCGVLTESASLYEGLTANENLAFFSELYNLDKQLSKKRAYELLEFLGLLDAADRKVKTYSTGMKKRLSLAISLLHNPKLLYLDEPTNGLDPESSKNVYEFIKSSVKNERITVFLCTHQLRYAEDLCDLYGFIDNGKLIEFGSYSDILSKMNIKKHLLIRGRNIDSSLGYEKTDKGLYKKPILNDEDASKSIQDIIKKGGEIFEANQKQLTLEELYFLINKGNNNE